MWCPGSQAPGTSGCTTGYGSVTALITGLGSVTPKAGTVYFDSTYSTNDATFDGSTAALSAWKTYALTLQGGWNSTTNAVSGVSTLNVPLTITNWAANVTLNDITISGATGDGLTVQTTGNIALHNVKSNGNTGRGAVLKNTTSTTKGSIIIDSDSNGFSEFNGNTGGNGLEAYSKGNITLSDVTADSNLDDGAYLENDNSGSGGITIEGTNNTFSNNAYNGLEAYSNGAINLTGVVADNNGSPSTWSNGAYLDNSGGSGNIEVDSSTFNDNLGYLGNGLAAASADNIILKNVIAASNLNQSDGAWLENTAGSGNIEVDNTLGGEFNSNKANGFEAYSNGSVTLTDVTADYNNWDGVKLGDPENYDPEIGGSVTVTGSDFSHNSGNGQSIFYSGTTPYTPNPAGLEVYADGGISLSRVTANNNTGGNGAYLDNCLNSLGSCTNLSNSDISVANSTFGDSSSDGNGGNGLEAYSNGSVTLTKVTADGNAYDGALLGYYVADIPFFGKIGGNVIVTGSNFSDNNSHWSNTDWPAGLEVHAYGSINLSGVTADDSIKGDGAYLDNSLYNDMTNAYDGTNSSSIAVDNTSGGEFNNNRVDGLDAYSLGTIALTGIIADKNGEDGAYLENDYVSSDITVTCSHLSNNSNYDIEAYSNGIVALNSDTYTSKDTSSPLVIGSVGCGGSGGGNSSGPVAGGAGPLPWNVISVPDTGSQETSLSLLAIRRHRTCPAQ